MDQFREELLNDIVAAGLHVMLFYSVQGDEVYIKVGADDDRLLRAADHEEYILELDEHSMKIIAESDKGLPVRKPFHLEAPFDRDQRIEQIGLLRNWVRMSDAQVTKYQSHVTSIPPFKYLHARYNDDWEKYGQEVFGVQVYKTYPSGAILRTADRIKLMLIILEDSKVPNSVTGLRGAGMAVETMVNKEQVMAVFPLHQSKDELEKGELTVDELFKKWNRLNKVPWEQPLDEIRDYFGEKIALYFAFLGHYTKWLSVAGIFGLGIFFHQLQSISAGTGGTGTFFTSSRLENTTDEGLQVVVFTDVPEVAFFALFISFWATFMIEFWKRKQSRLVLQWGMSNFERQEVVRPEFIPSHYLPSPITGLSEPYYSYQTFMVKVTSSLTIVAFCVVVIIAAIAGIFVFKVFISLDPQVTGLSQQNATYLALVINAIVIMILGNMSRSITRKLNDWENHRTDTQYEDLLIIKTFVFCFVNSFATLFYMAFIKSGTVILGQVQLCAPEVEGVNHTLVAPDACFGNLGTSLLIVFILQLVLNNSLELGIPAIMDKINKYLNSRMPKKPKGNKQVGIEGNGTKIRSPCEDQFFKKNYDGTFDDFLEIALQFGYVTLFVSAFPLAPFLAFLNNQIEVRVDSYKVCKLSRRPEICGAQDIGTWWNIYYYVGLIAVMTNAGVIFFTSHNVEFRSFYNVTPDAMRVWAWVVAVGGVLLCKWIVDYMIPDVPTEVAIQLAREDYIIRKCLMNEPDNDTDTSDAKQANHTLKNTQFPINQIDPAIEVIVKDLAKMASKIDSMEEAFKKGDRNKDGTVSTKELAKLLKGLPGIHSKWTDTDIDSIVDRLDYNQNGRVEYEEFMRLGKHE